MPRAGTTRRGSARRSEPGSGPAPRGGSREDRSCWSTCWRPRRDPATRAERSLSAARAQLDVADIASASELLAAAELGPLDELQRARLERLRARLVFVSQRGRDAPPLLLAAARRLVPLDAAMARETYLEALASAMYTGRLGSGPDEREVAEAARASCRVPDPGAADALLDALITSFTEGYAAGVPLSRALRAFTEPDGGGADRHWLWLACRPAQDLWDDELWHALASRGVSVARETGALFLLPNAANHLAAFHVHSGDFAAAAALIDEVDAITHATGLPPLEYATTRLAAGRGDEAAGLMEWAWQNLTERGEGSGLGVWLWLKALLHNANARYGELDVTTRRELRDALAEQFA